MAQIYHPKKTSTKMIEGAAAGLVGGVVVALVMIILDAVLRNGSWWYTLSLLGSVVYGTAEANVAAVGAAFVIGTLILLVVFALVGMGFTSYKPLFRRFNIPLWAGGAIYGAFIWLTLFFIFLNAIKPSISGMINQIAFFIASVLGGAALGYWSGRPDAPKR
ncbi:MAG: hypothetical protein ABI670_16315 [Chloroflexota bacterium]